MSVALVGSVGSVASGSTSLTPSFGQATTVNHLLIAWVGCTDGGGSVTTSSSGWVRAANSGANFLTAAVFYKANCAAGETPPTFTSSASTAYAQLAEFSGAALSSVLDSSGSSGTTATQNPTAANTASDSAAGDLVLSSGFWNGSNGSGTLGLTLKDSNGSTLSPTTVSANPSSGIYYSFSYAVTTQTGSNKDSAAYTLSTFDGGSAAVASFKAATAAVPAVTGISPSSGTTAGGTSVNITGTGFITGATVAFGAGAATGVVINSSTSITCNSPSGSGTVDVQVTTAGGTSNTSTSDLFYYVAPGSPQPPTSITATSTYQGQASITLTPPTNVGTSPLLSYTVTSTPGSLMTTGKADGTPLLMIGLTNSTAYTFTVQATNTVGSSAPSAASNSVTPAAASAPAAPTNAQADLAAQAANYNANGRTDTASFSSSSSTITDASILSGDAGSYVSDTSDNYTYIPVGCFVGSVTPGSHFTLVDRNGNAVNPLGSASQIVITPAQDPRLSQSGAARVYWTPTPAVNNGGAMVSQYIITASPAFTTTSVFSSGANSITVASATNLVVGMQVTDSTTGGNIVAGTVVLSVTGTAIGLSQNTAGNSASTPGDTLSFFATTTVWGQRSTGVVTGLANGTSYTFTVQAQTEGTIVSSASAASNAVTPANGTTLTAPGAPTIGTATAGSHSASVTFSAPASSGGKVIRSYTALSNPGNISATGTSSPIVVTGLTTGTPYTFTVTAHNQYGDSAGSSASNSATPS